MSPYMLEGKCVYKKKPDGSRGESMGCSDSVEEAKAHMRALYAHTKDSVFAELSMFIDKVSFQTNESNPDRRMRFHMTSSDVGKDLADEAMSVELFKSFVDRIKNNTPIPEAFKSAICESDWCGGMPYLSVAHYKAGQNSRNVPGIIDEIFIDGDVFKSKGYLKNNSLGRAVYDSLLDDNTKRKSGVRDFNPVRVSIGFLDLKHKHAPHAGGQEFVFERKSLGEICPLCEQGIGGKIYMDGILVHEAMTRVPMNPRTLMVAEEAMTEKSAADEIKTKRDDARSVIGDLADALDDSLEQKSVLVVKSDGTTVGDENHPFIQEFNKCYDTNDGGWNQECINSTMSKFMDEMRNGMNTVKSDVQVDDEVVKSVVYNYLVESAKRKDVTPADKKRAEKEYGDVKYADETNKKYPIDTEEHIRAAWNYIHQERNAAKYPDKGAAIKRKIISAWKRVIGGEPPSVEKKSEATMPENVEKMQLGGSNVPVEPFRYDGVESPPHELNKAPVKAKTDDEPEKDDNKKEEKEEMKSALDVAQENLKSILASGKATREEVQNAFNAVAVEVEKSYTPPAQELNGEILDVVKQLSVTVQNLAIEVAQLKANRVDTVSKSNVPQSRALRLTPEILTKKAVPQTRPLTQIEKIARASTGLPVE